MYSQGNISSRERKDSEYYNKEVERLKTKVRSVILKCAIPVVFMNNR